MPQALGGGGGGGGGAGVRREVGGSLIKEGERWPIPIAFLANYLCSLHSRVSLSPPGHTGRR